MIEQKQNQTALRPHTDIEVSFNRDFSPTEPCFPSSIRLGVKDSAKQLTIQSPLGLTGPFELWLGMTERERTNVLGQFKDSDIVTAVSNALGDRWKNCTVRLDVAKDI